MMPEMAARHSLSITLPPLAGKTTGADCQPIGILCQLAPVPVIRTRAPIGNSTNRHPAALHVASRWACPLHWPVGAAPTSQHCPVAGERGGAFCGAASVSGAIRLSIISSASLCVTSFCACPAAMSGRPSRALVSFIDSLPLSGALPHHLYRQRGEQRRRYARRPDLNDAHRQHRACAHCGAPAGQGRRIN